MTGSAGAGFMTYAMLTSPAAGKPEQVLLVADHPEVADHLTANDEVTAFRWADQADIRQFTSEAYAGPCSTPSAKAPRPPSVSTTEPNCSAETPHIPRCVAELAAFDQGGVCAGLCLAGRTPGHPPQGTN